MHGHYGIGTSSKIRFKDLGKLIIKAIEKEQELKVWDRWIKLYPYMEFGRIKFISFDDYKNELLKPKPKLSEKTSEEIIAEFMPIISAHENK